MMRAATIMRWIGSVGIVTIAVMRCAIVFASQFVFDTDPATDPVPLAGMSMSGSLAIDAALLFLCAIGLAGEWLAARGINWWMMLLALAPWPVLLWHSNDLANVWRGSTWGAAMIAAVTLAHLSRDRSLRIVLISLLVGAVGYVAVRGVGQVTFEHAETVREFERSKDKFLSDRGWAPDSAAARIFERRLRQPQPTGWFPTTNVFGSLMMFGLVAWGGWMVCAMRERLAGGWAGATGLLALACAVMLWFTGSKGAILAAMIGLGLAIVPLISARIRLLFERWGGAVFVILIALTLVAIVIRGTVLPESFAGDRSLLFRWHYLVATARMFVANALTGVGPDGFQDAYTMFRVTRNPEEVQSAHSVFADWSSTLGMSGLCWVALALWLTWRGGMSLRIQKWAEAIEADDQATLRRTLFASIAVTLLGLIPAMSAEWVVMDEASLRVRCVGILAFFLASALTASLLARFRAGAAVWVFAAAALAVLIHGQIEMTFHYGGSVVWAMCVLGVAGALRMDRDVPSQQSVRVPLIALVGFLSAIAAFNVGGKGITEAGKSDRLLAQNAELLRSRDAQRETLCEARVRAAESLQLGAATPGQTDSRLALAAAQQFRLAADECNPSERVELLTSAVKTLEDAIVQFDSQRIIVAAISAHTRLASINSSSAQWNRAIELATEITRRDPHGISSWRMLGDVLWAAGEPKRAADAYERALENNMNFELDELKQLTDRDRAQLTQRIREASTEGNLP